MFYFTDQCGAAPTVNIAAMLVAASIHGNTHPHHQYIIVVITLHIMVVGIILGGGMCNVIVIVLRQIFEDFFLLFLRSPDLLCLSFLQQPTLPYHACRNHLLLLGQTELFLPIFQGHQDRQRPPFILDAEIVPPS